MGAVILRCVSSLSNFLRRNSAGAIPKTAGAPILCRLARPDQITAALSLILGSGGKPADRQQMMDFLEYARLRNVDLNQTWIAEIGAAIAWAILPIPSAGRTTLLLTSSDLPSDLAPADALIEAVCDQYARRDIQLTQALLETTDDAGRRLFESHGFERMAELIYLHAAVRRPLPPPALPAGFHVQTYSPQTHDLFASGILASYCQSLDCPRLNGVRSIEDIMAGHKASGEFDPAHWLVLCEKNAASGADIARGVLLITRLARGDAAELVYLGLAPEVRGRRLGEWMMRRAFTTAASIGAQRISLAVDSANAPALKLYYRFGLARLGSKIAMIRRLV